MKTGDVLRTYANNKMKKLRQKIILKELPFKFTSQRELYVKFSFYILSYQTFMRDIKELRKRGLIECQLIQNNGRQLLIRKI